MLTLVLLNLRVVLFENSVYPDSWQMMKPPDQDPNLFGNIASLMYWCPDD